MGAFKDYHKLFHEILGNQDMGNTEYGFFAINWDFQNSQIVEAFTHWLNDQREARRAIGMREAKHTVSRGAFRDKLNRLGALRVKNHYRHKDLVDYGDTNLKVAAPYSHYPDLLDAAKKAEDEMAKLFPGAWNEAAWRCKQKQKPKYIVPLPDFHR
jgi:hypothetical protein